MEIFKRIWSQLQSAIKVGVKRLQSYTDRIWYGPFVGFLAAMDNIVLVIPNDGILVSSAMLKPKKWFWFALCITIGSTFGGLVLATIVELKGMEWVSFHYPGLQDSSSWQWIQALFDKYGLFIVFLVAVSPLMQLPAVVLAGLAQTPLFELGLVIFFGRLIKFIFLAWVASHAPQLLSRLWGMKAELEEVGIKPDQKI